MKQIVYETRKVNIPNFLKRTTTGFIRQWFKSYLLSIKKIKTTKQWKVLKANVFIYIYIYIYIYSYVYIYMQSWKQCVLLVITTMALWQLMHLGTWPYIMYICTHDRTYTWPYTYIMYTWPCINRKDTLITGREHCFLDCIYIQARNQKFSGQRKFREIRALR